MSCKVMLTLPDDRTAWIGAGPYPVLVPGVDEARRFHSLINARDAVRAWENTCRVLDYAIKAYDILDAQTGRTIEVIS